MKARQFICTEASYDMEEPKVVAKLIKLEQRFTRHDKLLRYRCSVCGKLYQYKHTACIQCGAVFKNVS